MVIKLRHSSYRLPRMGKKQSLVMALDAESFYCGEVAGRTPWPKAYLYHPSQSAGSPRRRLQPHRAPLWPIIWTTNIFCYYDLLYPRSEEFDSDGPGACNIQYHWASVELNWRL